MKMSKSGGARIVAVVMVVALAVAAVFAGNTISKYITTGEGAEQSGRVAKWGVEVAAAEPSAENTVFKNTYKDENQNNTVVGLEGALVVAPGTNNQSDLGFDITGTPETAVKVSYAIKDGYQDVMIPADKPQQGDTQYNPLKFTLYQSDGTTPVAGLQDVSLETLAADLPSKAVVLAPNTDLSAAAAIEYKLGWKWDFSTAATDVKDTYLGNVSAGTVVDPTTITEAKFTIVATVEQSDVGVA